VVSGIVRPLSATIPLMGGDTYRGSGVRVAILLVVPLALWGACSQFRDSPIDVPSDGGDDASLVDASGGDDANGVDAGDDSFLPQTFTVVQGLAVGETFQAVWAADEQDVFVVGTDGVHDDYYDGSWHRDQSLTGRDYYALWGTSVNDVYAVGTIQTNGMGVIQHFDGSTWTDEYMAPTALYGIWGTGSTSTDVVLAVGAQGLLYGKQVGTTDWGNRIGAGLPANPDVPMTPDAPILWSITGIDFSNFAMAGDRDRIFHWLYDQMAFEWLDPAVDTTLVFRTAWQAPGSHLSTFFGMNYFGVSWFTGFEDFPPDAQLLGPNAADAALPDEYLFQITEDQSEPGSDQMFIRGIWGTATSVLFVGDEGRIYSFSVDNDTTARAKSPTTSALYGVSGTSATDVWIVGERELILHGSLPQ
jgi:hypothetical protein